MVDHQYIGTMPLTDWKAVTTPELFIDRHDNPVRVFLTTGQVDAYIGEWSYVVEENEAGGRVVTKRSHGGHKYAVSPSGALHIVESDSTTHYGELEEIIENEQVAITYAPGAWNHATGPWLKDVPEPKPQNRSYPKHPEMNEHTARLGGLPVHE